jgi:hypothetical protein
MQMQIESYRLGWDEMGAKGKAVMISNLTVYRLYIQYPIYKYIEPKHNPTTRRNLNAPLNSAQQSNAFMIVCFLR